MNNYLLCCDWGTSSFRLRLLERTSDEILSEIVSGEGVGSIHKQWENSVFKSPSITRSRLFVEYLREQVKALGGKLSIDLDAVPIIISGMASSSIGIEEVDYAPVPFAVDGSDAIIKSLGVHESISNRIFLISGVRSDKDVMRGEETQLVGLLELLNGQEGVPEATLIFPGTHSKHIYVKSGYLVNFRTFMTGEIFSVISNYSILKNSVSATGSTDFDAALAEAFKTGVHESKTANILNSLFTVRTNQLFGKLSKEENFFYLSGLLIGCELNHLSETNQPLFLCSGTNLYNFYKLAFEELDLLDRSTLVFNDLVDKAAIIGQKLIFDNRLLKGNNQ